ncbi:MAG: ribonuclease PH [Actinomycetota bacterium]|jgi:ribonuclease PH|nr:ribonuclease PH [Actinomycetota bacterium]
MQRRDGRAADELRPIKVTRRYLKHAHGSCMFELGDTRVLCAANITDGVGSWRRGKGLGWVTAEYSLLPASTHTRSRRESTSGGPKGRTHEIQRLIGRSMRSIVDMSGMGGEFTLNIDCDVIQADGGTRTAAITGAYVAVHDAFARWCEAGKIKDVPLSGFVAATSVGMVDGEIMLDLDYREDSAAEIDMNVVMDGEGRFIEVQGTGERTPFDRARLDGLLDLASNGIEGIVEMQRRIIAEDLDVIEL